MRLIALNSLSYLVYFGKISKRFPIVPRSYAQREPCVINENENESGPDLEIGKFSDHDPDLFFDQQKISDRLVYNMYRFVAKNFFFLQQGRGKTENRPLWKIDHAQKLEPNFFVIFT